MIVPAKDMLRKERASICGNAVKYLSVYTDTPIGSVTVSFSTIRPLTSNFSGVGTTAIQYIFFYLHTSENLAEYLGE